MIKTIPSFLVVRQHSTKNRREDCPMASTLTKIGSTTTLNKVMWFTSQIGLTPSNNLFTVSTGELAELATKSTKPKQLVAETQAEE